MPPTARRFHLKYYTIVNSQGPTLTSDQGVNSHRDGKRYMDGCGIGLFVQERRWRCLKGEWRPCGLASDGSGMFEVCPL